MLVLCHTANYCWYSCFTVSDLLGLEVTALLYAHSAHITHQLPNVELLERLDVTMLRIITKSPALEYMGAFQVSHLHTEFLPFVIS